MVILKCKGDHLSVFQNSQLLWDEHLLFSLCKEGPGSITFWGYGKLENESLTLCKGGEQLP